MGTTTQRKVYSREFKISAVSMITEKGQRISEVVRNLGVNEQLLSKWKSRLQAKETGAFPGKGKLSPQEEEIRYLKKENARLSQERDILKKVAKYFLHDHG
ncbi:MAG: transposase [Candidatus Kapabacteria bacterium]|nr:transposase [Candidatus Kapabacteria bacterium]